MAKESRRGFKVDALDPQYELTIGDVIIGEDITRFIESVEYESSDGIVDMLKMRVMNPDFLKSKRSAKSLFTDSKLFQPGNEVNVGFGYGIIQHVGRVKLVEPRYSFPRDDMPSIEVVGYTRDYEMMEGRKPPGTTKKGEKKKAKAGPFATLSEVCDEKARNYKMELDFEDDVTFARPITQKADMSDYDFLKGLSNFTGFLFWVDGASDGTWTLHMRAPSAKDGTLIGQEKKYTLFYNTSGTGTLLSFEPEYAIRDSKVKLVVAYRNPEEGKYHEVETEDESEAADTIFQGDIEEEISSPLASGGSMKIFFGEYQIETITNKRFRDEKEAQQWARQWFRRNRENFVYGRANIIGIENIFARQRHTFGGLGKALSGDYYFANVTHKFSGEDGYELDVSARRVIDQPQVASELIDVEPFFLGASPGVIG